MGADSMSIQGQYAARLGSREKIFRLGEFLVGSCGTVHVGQIIEHLFVPPAIEDRSLMGYMVTKFAPALHAQVSSHGGEIKNQSTQKDEIDGKCLVAIRGRLFIIDEGYGVWEPRNHYAAIGQADQEALAAMFTAKKLLPDLPARDVVQCGLEAAAEFDLAIRPPFTFISSKEINLALAVA